MLWTRRLPRATSPRTQWRLAVADLAARRLEARLSIEILIRTLGSAVTQHPIPMMPDYLHFRAELHLGVAELAYLLRQPHEFLSGDLGQAFGQAFARRIAAECTDHDIADDCVLLFSLQLAHQCRERTPAEADSLQAFVSSSPAKLEEVMVDEERWDYCEVAVTASVVSAQGIKTSLFWATEAGHVFHGSNLLDGGAL